MAGRGTAGGLLRHLTLKIPTQTLRYLARVVTSGDYRWEPAVLQSSIVPEQGVVLPAFEVTIGGLGS